MTIAVHLTLRIATGCAWVPIRPVEPWQCAVLRNMYPGATVGDVEAMYRLIGTGVMRPWVDGAAPMCDGRCGTRAECKESA